MKILKNIGAALVVIAVVVGFKFYNKASAEEDVRAALLEICDKDAECVSAVGNHLEQCFDESYDIGGRRRSASLDAAELTSCINKKSGAMHFAYVGDN